MLGLMAYLVGLGVIFSLIFMVYNFRRGALMADGTPTMHEIADAIRVGASAFLKREFSIDIPIIVGIAVLFAVIFHPFAGAALLLGAVMSSLAGLVGMKAAVIYNERVANEARLGVENKDESALGKALNVAFRGGSVMGLGVGGFAMLGILLVYLIVGSLFQYANPDKLVEITSLVGLKYLLFPQVLACYSLGCSSVAVFNRLGGGIYTKGADMGSDLVGKTELDLPEDDPRNPAVIADCVGDNVGDVNGNGSDLLESTIGACAASSILPTALYTAALNSGTSLSKELVSRMMQFPLAFMGVGLIACVLGILYVLMRKPGKNLSRELNISLWSSAAIIAVLTLVLSYIFFNGQGTEAAVGFRLGWISPWLSALIGIGAGIVLGMLAERYTSDKYKETQHIAELSKEGPALVIVGGMSSGWRSALPACLTLGIAIILSSYFSGMYGSAIAAVGMLSFVVSTVAVDTYGPISDNAGGIAEMSRLDEEVRNITDSLDSQGNTTAAVGKGFAIGSGVLAALAMMMSFSQGDAGGSINIANYIVLGGAFIGVGLMHWLSGAMLNAVCNNAKQMVDEVRRQVNENPKILTGEAKPDPARCIDICTKSAIGEMRKPVLVSMLAPIVGGFLFGPTFVAGFLVGSILDSVAMATSTANSGGAWDNAKKLVKSMKAELLEKYGPEMYREMHNASVIGDTVGDGFKDVVGPNQDIMIKMMSTISVIMLPVMQAFNLMKYLL